MTNSKELLPMQCVLCELGFVVG